MNRIASITRKTSLLLVCLLTDFLAARAQDPAKTAKSDAISLESVITYDFKNPGSRPDIPFDQKFLFRIIHINTSNIKRVFAYEATYTKGVRDLKPSGKNAGNYYYNADVELNHLAHGDTLDIYFVALKPNKEFDIAVVRSLSGKNLTLLYELNELLYQNNLTDATKKFTDLKDATYDDLHSLGYFCYNQFCDYQTAWNSTYQPLYSNIHSLNYAEVDFPTIRQVNKTQSMLAEQKISFDNGSAVARLVSDNKKSAIYQGLLPGDYTPTTKATPAEDYNGRLKNLKKTIDILNGFQQKAFELYGRDNDVTVKACSDALQADLTALNNNQQHLQDAFDALNKAIVADANLNEFSLLIGTTYAKDIATRGKNIFTLDLGLAFMNAWNYRNQPSLLPKLYYGVNIYLRPINKNMRQEVLPQGLKYNDTTKLNYNIVDQKSVWQHVSISVGFATGSYSNPDFDNLFNNTTLLTGIGYRFFGAFKASAGTGWLRRTSNNPVVTSKELCFAPYVSLSVDLDLISTLDQLTKGIMK